MKQYEYKVVELKISPGFDFQKKCAELEDKLNQLGAQGWKYCADGNGAAIFMREVPTDFSTKDSRK